MGEGVLGVPWCWQGKRGANQKAKTCRPGTAERHCSSWRDACPEEAVILEAELCYLALSVLTEGKLSQGERGHGHACSGEMRRAGH